MTEEQEMLFAKTSKKEALRRYTDELEVVLLFDDDTESCEPDLESIRLHEGEYGYTKKLGKKTQKIVCRYFVLKEALVYAKGFLETIAECTKKEDPKLNNYLWNVHDEIKEALYGEWK